MLYLKEAWGANMKQKNLLARKVREVFKNDTHQNRVFEDELGISHRERSRKGIAIGSTSKVMGAYAIIMCLGNHK